MSTVKYYKKWDRAKIAVDDCRDDKGEGTMIINVRISVWERVKLLFTGIFVVEYKKEFSRAENKPDANQPAPPPEVAEFTKLLSEGIESWKKENPEWYSKPRYYGAKGEVLPEKDDNPSACKNDFLAHAEEFKKDNAAEIERLNQSAKDQCQS